MTLRQKINQIKQEIKDLEAELKIQQASFFESGSFQGRINFEENKAIEIKRINDQITVCKKFIEL
jgi:hypothetical protein